MSDNNHSNHPDARDPAYDALRVDAIILLVSEYKSHSSGRSPSFSETYEDNNTLARKIVLGVIRVYNYGYVQKVHTFDCG
jgi:hypothetical protein